MQRSIAGRPAASRPAPPRLPGWLGLGGGRLRGRGANLLGTTRRGLVRLLSHRRARLALICALAALALLCGGWLLLRHSRFVAVRHVHIAGVHGPQAHAIESALRSAALGMSTLDVNDGALRSAVARFHLVSSIRAHASFPHSLAIVVEEQQPVAALLADGQRTAVAANGVVLGPELLSATLPTVTGSIEPLPGRRLHEPFLLEALTVLGAAPAPLARIVSKVYVAGQRGLTLAMSNGLLAYFGDSSRPHAKWDSLARVLADSSSTGASYVDVRVPEHPAAGGFPGGVAPDASSGEAPAGSQGVPQSAVSSLAETLSAGTGASNTASTTPAGAEPSEEEASSEAATGPESSAASTESPAEGG